MVVVPQEKKFRVSCFSRSNVRPFGPEIPQDPVESGFLKDYLLTKSKGEREREEKEREREQERERERERERQRQRERERERDF